MARRVSTSAVVACSGCKTFRARASSALKDAGIIPRHGPPRIDEDHKRVGSTLWRLCGLAVGRPEDAVPEAIRHAEVRFRHLVMNLVVRAQLPVPGVLRVEV